MEKFCSNCGEKLIEGANVCTNCGQKIGGNNNPSQGANTTINVQTAQPAAQTNGMAIAGFVVSLVSTFLCCGAFNTISLILSIVGFVQAKKYNGNGKGLALAGIIISAIVIVISILLVVLGYGAAILEELQ